LSLFDVRIYRTGHVLMLRLKLKGPRRKIRTRGIVDLRALEARIMHHRNRRTDCVMHPVALRRHRKSGQARVTWWKIS
jgi:hypothetical protein